MHSDSESCLPMETEVRAIALDSAPLASRRPLFAPCLPSTCSRACVQSPFGSLRFITLTVLNRGELAVVGHCKFAEMLYFQTSSLQDRVHCIHYGYRTVREVRLCVHPLRLRGRLCYKCTLHFSTPLRLRGRTGVFRRRQGYLLAAHLGPSLRPRVVPRPSFFTRRYLIPRCVARGPFSRVVHSPFVIVYDVFLSVPYAGDGFLSGQTDVFPLCGRLRLWQIALCISSLLWMSSAGSQSTGAVGRVSRPLSSTCKLSLHSISAISLPFCMTFTCTFTRFLF